jgi:2-oxoglutarate ferredoxin oxidoreductase subunit alpha
LVERINEKILKNRSSIVETESYFLEEADIAVVAYGFTARTSLYVVRRLRKEGMKIGMVRLKSLWPFPEDAMRDVGQKVRKIVVPEMNRGQVAGEIRKACLCDVISIGQTDGEVIPPEKIFDALRRLSQ